MTLLERLADPRWCAKLFQQLRWGSKVRCPQCGSCRVGPHGRPETYRDFLSRYHCARCERTFNDKTGTIFERSRLPLQRWFQVMYLLTLNQSIASIARELGIAYDTAHRAVHLLQGSLYLARFSQGKLSGTIELDDHYETAGLKGNGRGKKAAVGPATAEPGAETTGTGGVEGRPAAADRDGPAWRRSAGGRDPEPAHADNPRDRPAARPAGESGLHR